MKRKYKPAVLPAVLAVCFFPKTVYANSSWHWFSDTPLTVLPWAVCGALFLEVLIICRANRTLSIKKTIAAAVYANALSFFLPYIFAGIFPILGAEELSFFETINYSVRKVPFYTVGIAFLAITLAAEIPAMWLMLRKSTENRKRLLISIAAANIITTVLCGAAERILCRGSW